MTIGPYERMAFFCAWIVSWAFTEVMLWLATIKADTLEEMLNIEACRAGLWALIVIVTSWHDAARATGLL